MFLFYVLTFFKKVDIIQGGTLFKGGHYLRKYGISISLTFCHLLENRPPDQTATTAVSAGAKVIIYKLRCEIFLSNRI